MGVILLPSMDDYWKTGTRINQIADIMSRDRFKMIRSYLHFQDNEAETENTDRFHKVRPLLKHLRQQFLKLPETPVQSVDEVMIAYKGTRAGNLRQYIANKPDKWGFKFFARASADGIIHDLIPYQGATTFENIDVELSSNESTMNMSSKVIISMSKSLAVLEGSIICADNFFTSYDVARYLLDKYNCMYTGTARETRIHRPDLRPTSEMNKRNVARGAMDFKSCNGVLAVKWKDNKVVTMLSTATGVHPIGTVQRYDKIAKCKKDIPCPNVVKAYNSNMGGVDKSDMLGHLYCTPMKSRRWYLPIFGYLVDLCVSNAWLVYKRDCNFLNERNKCLKDFRLEISRALILNGRIERPPRQPSISQELQIPKFSRGQKNNLTPDGVRYDKSLIHLPVFVSQRLTCKFYSRQNNIHRTRWLCEACKVALCLSDKNNCFREYHL